MSVYAFQALAVPTSVASGASKNISDYDGAQTYVSMASLGTATYHIEASPDGTSWVQIGADVTAAVAGRAITAHYNLVRIRCSAYTNGTPTAAVHGQRSAKIA